MKRFMTMHVLVVMMTVSTGCLMAQAAKNDALPEDVARLIGRDKGKTDPSATAASDTRDKMAVKLVSPQTTGTAKSGKSDQSRARLKLAETRYRNVAQDLSRAMARWEERVRATMARLTEYQVSREDCEGVIDAVDGVPAAEPATVPAADKAKAPLPVSVIVLKDVARPVVAKPPAAPRAALVVKTTPALRAQELARQCEILRKQLEDLARQLEKTPAGESK